MFHLSFTDADPNFSTYHLRVPAAVTPRLTDTNENAHRSVVLHKEPRGAAMTANDKYSKHSQV